jgi:hypothetical protein
MGKGLINLSLTKKYTEIGGFVVFLVLYLAFFNIFFRFEGSGYPIYAPGTLIFAFLGYWLGGLLYEKYLRRKPG